MVRIGGLCFFIILFFHQRQLNPVYAGNVTVFLPLAPHLICLGSSRESHIVIYMRQRRYLLNMAQCLPDGH